MTHIEVLEAIAACYGNPRYLEIGVGDGGCFQRVLRHCRWGVAVDVRENPYGAGVGERLYALDGCEYCGEGSDEFFSQYVGEPFDIIFIDGSHWEEQVRRDFENAQDNIALLGTIALHDTWSPDGQTASEGSDTAYRVAVDLENHLAWQTYTLPVRPGLTLCRRNVPRTYE